MIAFAESYEVWRDDTPLFLTLVMPAAEVRARELYDGPSRTDALWLAEWWEARHTGTAVVIGPFKSPVVA